VGFKQQGASVLARLKSGRSKVMHALATCERNGTPGQHAIRAAAVGSLRHGLRDTAAWTRRLDTAALAGTVQASRNELATRTNAAQRRLDWQYETASAKQEQQPPA
jgi:hypothetical protein